MADTNFFSSRWHTPSPSAWELARHREGALRPLAERPVASPLDVETVAHELHLSRTQTYELIARYRRRPQTSTLLLGKCGRRPRSKFLKPAIEEVINDVVKRFFLTRERPRISDLLQHIHVACDEQGLPMPNYRTVRRRLRMLDPKLVASKRFGAKAAREAFAPVQASSAGLLLPLDVVQIDHTPADVIVVDEHDRQPIGRPWLTLALDVASRAVLGFYVSLDAPSLVSVAMVLTHAVLPKDHWLADRELDVPWPMAGIPDVLHLDNAPEFDSELLRRGAQEYGMKIEHRPAGKPHFGGHIERLIGTMMGAVHLLPGTTFSNVAEKGDYCSEKAAHLTLSELERWLALQIAGVYHQSVHSALNCAPMEAWLERLPRRSRPVRLPSNRDQFFMDFLPGELRLVRRDGIRLFNIHYWDNVLTPMSARSKRRSMVKYDPRNLSRVYLQDETGVYWTIPYRDLRFPPISLWEHREAMKRIRAKGRSAVDEKLLFDSILGQRKLLKESRKTLRQRRESEKLRRTDSHSLPAQLITDSTEQDYSHLPPYKVEQW